MKPIFDRDCIQVGWYEPCDKNVFDKEMHWVAFVDNEYLYSTSFKWLGVMIDGIFVDKSGDPVCWLEGGSLKGVYNLTPPVTFPATHLRPLTSLREFTPLRPLTPLREFTSLRDWSPLNWDEYINPK